MTNEKLAAIIIENIEYRLAEWGEMLIQRIEALHMSSCNKDFDHKMVLEVQKEIEEEMIAKEKLPSSNGFYDLYKQWEDNEP